MDIKTNQSIQLSLVYSPLYTLGPEKRTGIWFQGCSIRCSGCISQHTWNKDKGYCLSIQQLLEEIKSYGINRISISGGEPFDQPEALNLLLQEFRSNGFNDILVYSGYNYHSLQNDYPFILKKIDVLIDGGFQENQKTDFIWKGSENQNMYILTEDQELKELYESYKKNSSIRKLQVVEKDNYYYVLGIPKPIS